MNYSEKIFISHAHEDKIIAGGLKTSLESLGYQAFVAHDDILPLTEWRKEIVKALDECKAFIVIISLNSNKSQWVHQEIGYACARNVLIIPIKTDSENPTALISDIQALSFQIASDQRYHDNKAIYDICASEVRSAMDGQRRGAIPSSTDFLINELISSPSYAKGTPIFKELDKISVFSEEQMDKLLDAALMNDQVRGNFDASNFYNRLLTKNLQYQDKEKILRVRNHFKD